ncbi:MAG: DNA-directed RNA polymerase subunit alpha, partial [Calditrichia bacterium]|nr:DNA-directed RNA polymerase subunit alpha [Calditrichia bacterium]
MSWMNMQMPERVELDESLYTDTYGKFIVQPLEKGFGITLGNLFRRVLLSSIQGAAITSVKIDEISHEFDTIKGVREDVTQMILNLKKIRIKLLNKRPDKVTIPLKGPLELNAEEIQKFTTDFEILNPEQHIAILNDEADFVLELRVGRGVGYVTAEENKLLEQSIGVIPIDSIYTPIKNVRYSIENVRVGQKTDYERLVLEVNTDGSITPDDALTYAGKIIKDHVQLFINFDIDTEEEEAPQIDEEILRVRKLLKMNVDELELSVRSHNCLKGANIKNIGDLVRLEEPDLLKFRNFGRKSLTELHNILDEKNLYFGMDVDKYLKSDE